MSRKTAVAVPIMAPPADVPSRPSSKASTKDMKLPSMVTNVGTNNLKLASFDWPPPPSPAGTGRPVHGGLIPPSPSGASRLGDASPSSAAATEMLSAASSRPAEIRARAELWALRADIEREKLSSVAPHPFFGQPMRFQDETSALQITDDGRWSFSKMSTDDEGVRQVVTHEGIFAKLDINDPILDQSARPGDPEVAIIEGRALLRHEITDCNGRTKIVSVERGGVDRGSSDRGQFRFAITVTPFVQPTHATIQSLARPRSPGRPPPRARKLEFVSAGGLKKERGGGLVGQRQQRRTAGPRLKFSRSTPLLQQQNSPDKTRLPRMSVSTSSPQLPSLADGGGGAHAPTQEKVNTNSPRTVQDWKEYYRQRADCFMGAAAKSGVAGHRKSVYM